MSGSLADPLDYITSTAASATNPVLRRGNFSVQPVNVCFHPEQRFKSPKFDENDWQLTATADSFLLSIFPLQMLRRMLFFVYIMSV